ncbi:MAG: response regulator [Saprospirales bacterium]|jgi:two-component system LytT family response regulator|nr:response regulator [Saprospirales bacterium]MBK8924025.1 response regulator [Saprospirales bacterium]
MQNQTYRAIIIDDKPDARSVLRRLIEQYCPQFDICAEAGTVPEALEDIQRCRPAVVFLDVGLRQGSGFDILDAYPHPDFKVVFITAYDHFAVKAFKYRALHYLLKPIDPQDLIAATAELHVPQHYWPEYERLQQTLKNNRASKLLLPSLRGAVVVDA